MDASRGEDAMLAEGALAIHLICSGGGTHAVRNSGVITSTNGMTSPIIVNSTGHVGYDDEVAVEIEGDAGRIRPPAGIKPPIHSGGDDGWWKLKNVNVGENEIKAKFSLNFMNNPEVQIDRVTGHIAIRGKTGSFSGTCEPYDPATVQRRF
jgi:hypothetical protein